MIMLEKIASFHWWMVTGRIPAAPMLVSLTLTLPGTLTRRLALPRRCSEDIMPTIKVVRGEIVD